MNKAIKTFAIGSVAFGITLMSTAVWAQDKEQSLADIRSELSFLFTEIQNLRNELASGNGSTGVEVSGPALLRLDQIETEMRRLTGQVENLEIRINRIVKDGTNRVGDLEFRLVELEGGDVSQLGKTPTLGGETETTAAASPAAKPELNVAVLEKEDFSTALKILNAGEYQAAETKFGIFMQDYPGSPYEPAALYWQGEAQAAQSNWNAAARSYLASLKAAPDGDHASDAMLGLSKGLAKLGKTDQACKTLQAIPGRYPSTIAADQSVDEASTLGCS